MGKGVAPTNQSVSEAIHRMLNATVFYEGDNEDEGKLCFQFAVLGDEKQLAENFEKIERELGYKMDNAFVQQGQAIVTFILTRRHK